MLFFDGVCGTCNLLVDFLLRHDTSEAILYAPLQGETAQRELTAADCQDLQTLIFRDRHGVIYRRSDAFVQICALLPWPWRAFMAMRFVPRIIRDFFYNTFARNRYILGGKRDACRLPTPAERSRFLP